MSDFEIESMKGRLSGIIGESKLATHHDLLLNAARGCAYFTVSPSHDPTYRRFVEFGVGTSRLGGMPDLPGSMTWPEVGGKKLPFLCQFDLAELPRWEGKAVPDEGWLYAFAFVGDDPQSCAVSVIYHAGPREALKEAERPEADKFMRDWMNDSVYSRVPVRANATVIVDTDSITRELSAAGIDPGRIQSLVAKALPRPEGTDWVASLLEPVSAEDESASVLAGYRGETTCNWRNLITLSSHGSMCWSDCGVLYLLIDGGKLEAGDFSRVIPVIGSSG